MSSKLGRSLITAPPGSARQISRARAAVQIAARLVAGLGLGALAACSSEPDPNAVQPPPPPPLAAELRIERVDRLDIGRAWNGFVLRAEGVADSAGWREPRLDPVASGPGADGFLVYDFVAIQPFEPVATPEPARRLRADALIAPETLRAAAGVRVRAVSGSAEIAFD